MKVFFILLLCIIIVSADTEAWAITQSQEPLTYNKFMELTEAGQAKVDEAATKVARAVTRSRLILGLGVVGGVVTIGLAAYDGYHQITDYLKADMHLPTVTPRPVTGGSYLFGQEGSYSFAHYVLETCSGSILLNRDEPVPSRYIVGYKVVILRYDEYPCYQGGPVQRHHYYMIITYYNQLEEMPNSYGRYVPQPAGTLQTSAEATNTQLAMQTISEAIEKLTQPEAQILPHQREELSRTVQQFREALGILQNGVQLQRDVDYTLREQPAPTQPTQPTTPPPTPATPPTTTPNNCECSRQALFKDAYERVSKAAQATPMLSLINKLVINPSSGRPNDVIGFATPFGYVSFDLKQYNYHSIVGAFRFVVIAGAFIAAYYIMFS